MVVAVRKRAVGVFPHRRDAEEALHELKNSGFPMDKVSVIARDAEHKGNIAGTEVQEKVGDKADEGAKVGALSGGALGGLTGLLIGLGTLAIPGIGPVMLAGAAATTLATTLAGAGIGAAAGSLIGALIGLGIPEERAKVYHERVERGEYLVILDGTEAEIATAQAILHQRGIEEYGIYDHPDGRHGTTDVTPTTTSQHASTKRAIGVFAHRRDAEAALRDLRDASFPMSQVSLIAKDGGSDRVGAGNKADEGAKAGAATGGVLGGLGGLLVGLGALAIPGVGPVIASGALATALASTAAGGAIGAAAGGITGGLIGLGIPEERVRIYSDRFQRGDYLVIVDGSEAEIHQAEAILKRRGIEEFAIYNARDVGEHRLSSDRVEHRETPIVNNIHPHHADDPAVLIIDRRDQKV
ncbi:histidine kinase [Cylindrospermum sp. FACHB-282]|uniref:histidine kinase n=1 Tax=Cylindrospermum sp. FACHB-282 TaxID=2692794 RepID=UPI001684D0F3|nr:histidine kinase [Cylindrospermum sp. FACHB-282]MBD2387655.1 histidine kinase [Cylindrospermum sp. FACHB-282]